jgi:antitoxin PrlF
MKIGKDSGGRHMASATVTSKGQTTIPKSVRDAAGLHTGDLLHFTVLQDGTIIMRVKNRSVRELAVRPRRRRHVTVEQMNR